MSTSWTLKPAAAVKTAPVVAIGLLGGYVTARETGIRPLGGVVLGVAGAYAIRSWAARRGPATAAPSAPSTCWASGCPTRWPRRSGRGPRC